MCFSSTEARGGTECNGAVLEEMGTVAEEDKWSGECRGLSLIGTLTSRHELTHLLRWLTHQCPGFVKELEGSKDNTDECQDRVSTPPRGLGRASSLPAVPRALCHRG